jgi:uncharacterized alkaline shock family protein YloU
MNNNMHTEEIELTDAQLEVICGAAATIVNGTLSVPLANTWSLTSNGVNVTFAAGLPTAGTVTGTVTF